MKERPPPDFQGRGQEARFNKPRFNTNSLIKKIMMDKQTTIPLSYLQNT